MQEDIDAMLEREERVTEEKLAKVRLGLGLGPGLRMGLGLG